MPFLRQHHALLQRFRTGDRSALAEVYDAYAERIGHLVRRGYQLHRPTEGPGRVDVNPQDFLDVVHEVFAKAFSPAARLAYDGERDYGPYLATIARNAMVDWLRRRGTVTALPPHLFDNLPDEPPDEAAPWEDPVTLGAVTAYVAGLPPALAGVHRCRYQQGMSQDAAAHELGISRQNLRTLEAQLRRGLAEALRKNLPNRLERSTEDTKSA
jgi:RNA polymerase sigma factor (sigma-70 family)